MARISSSSSRIIRPGPSAVVSTETASGTCPSRSPPGSAEPSDAAARASAEVGGPSLAEQRAPQHVKSSTSARRVRSPNGNSTRSQRSLRSSRPAVALLSTPMCPERRAALRLRRPTLTNTTKEAQCQQLHMTFATIRVPPTPIACQRSQQNIGPQLLTRSHRSRPVCGCQIARAVVARRGRFHRGGAPWRRCWCSSKGEVGVSPNRAGTRPLGLSLARESKRVGVPLEPGRCSTNSH